MKKALLGFGNGIRWALAVGMISLLGSQFAMSADLFWDGDGTGTVAGGAGTWNTTLTRWSTTAGGNTYQAWVNANTDSAVFGGTAGQVNFGSTLTVNTITTNVSGYLLGNGNGVSTTPVTTGGGAGGALTINTNHSAGTSTTWQGITTSPIIKTGTGRLALENSQAVNPQYSTITINQGSISLAAANRLGQLPGALVPGFFTFNGGGLTSSNAAAQDLGATRGWTIQAGGAFLGASAAANPVTVSAPVTGTGDITVSSGGGVFASPVAAGGVWTFSNTSNNWVGNLILAGASGAGAKLGASGVIPDTTVVSTTVAGNTFDLNGFDETIRGIGSSAGSILTGAKALTLTNSTGQVQTGGVVNVGAGGKLVKSGTGAQTLKGSNVNNGEIVLDGGTLGVGGSNALGSAGNTGVVTINGGILSNDGTGGRSIPSSIGVNLNGNFTADDSLFNSSQPGQILFNGPATIKNSNRTITVNGTANLGFAGAVGEDAAGRGLIKNGNGLLVLTAVNTYSGGTTLNAGQVNIDGDGTLGNGAGTLTFNGGRLNSTASRSVSTDPVPNPINVSDNSEITTTSAATTVNLNLSTGTFTTTSGKTLTFRNDGADAAADTFMPRFSGNGFNFTSNIAIDNGAVGKTQLSSFNQGATVQTFSGVISGNGSYVRNSGTPLNGGTTEFTGSNTYSGGTTVAEGTLLVNNTTGSGTGSGDVTVNANGTLGGSGTIAGNVISSGTLAPGNSPGVLSIGGNLSLLAGNYKYEIDSTPVATADLVNVTGNLSITNGAVTLGAVDLGSSVLAMGTKFTLINYGGAWNGGTFIGLPNYDTSLVVGSNRFAIRYNDTTGGQNFGGGSVGGGSLFVTITAVPEASTFFVIGLGGIFAFAAVRLGKRLGVNVLKV